MKRSATFITIVLLLSVIGCAVGADEKSEEKPHMAKAIADSVYDAEELSKWVAHFDSVGDKEGELLIRQKYGSTLRNMSDFEAAIKQHDTCIAIAADLRDTLQLIIAYNNQGTNFRRLGSLEEASNNHYAALVLCDKTMGDTSFTARKNRVRTYNGLGNVLLSLGNDSTAESLFRRALKGEAELNSLTGQAINYANIGAIKEERGEADSARIYYNMSMEKNVQGNNMVGISLCHQHIGRIEHSNGDLDAAMGNYRTSFGIGLKTGDVWHWLKPCESMADIFLEEHNTDSARKYIDIAFDAATKIKARSHLARVYGQRARLHELTEEYKLVAENIRKAQAYKDSVALEQNQAHIQNLRVKYEINKRTEEVRQAETRVDEEARLRKTLMWAAITVITMTAIAIVSLARAFREKKRANKILKQTDEDRQSFYRGITHQLRTPLTVVIGMTEQLRRFIPHDKDAMQEYEALERKSRELLSLTTEMIEYNKGKRKDISLSELSADSHAEEDCIAYSDNDIPDNGDYILFAEDDNDVALLIAEILQNEGYKHIRAKDGAEALEIIGKKVPKLLITDIMMPNMDGIELIKAVKDDRSKQSIPIMVVSARIEDSDRIAALAAGAEVYMGKPFNPEEFTLRIRKMLEQRDFLRQLYSREIADADKSFREEKAQELGGHDTPFIQSVDNFIQDNILNKDLDANILADAMCISLTTLNRRIKATTGTNTTNYIRQKRLGRAKHLLTNTSMSMGEIQLVCGFDSPSYFSRAFKAEYGISPSEVRKQNN